VPFYFFSFWFFIFDHPPRLSQAPSAVNPIFYSRIK
jgi:hypothetical protein